MTRLPGRTLEDLELDKFDSSIGKTYVRTQEVTDFEFDTFDYEINSITTTAARVEVPADTEYVSIFHRSDDTIYLGTDGTVTSGTGIPFLKNEVLELCIKKNTNLNLYAIASTGTILVYAIAMVKA